jgi:quercetin dioxygenase-like cupin family protein
MDHAKAPGAAPAGSLPLKAFGGLVPDAIQWRSFPAFPAAIRLAVLVGDIGKPGPYVVRVRVPAGERLLPHSHPEDRIYTVMSGMFYIGLGENFDSEKLKPYPPGSVVVLPGNTAHFHYAKSGEYITQVTGEGPLGLDYVDAADDPRRRNAAGDRGKT